MANHEPWLDPLHDGLSVTSGNIIFLASFHVEFLVSECFSIFEVPLGLTCFSRERYS